jgi:hypothetical protein
LKSDCYSTLFYFDILYFSLLKKFKLAPPKTISSGPLLLAQFNCNNSAGEGGVLPLLSTMLNVKQASVREGPFCISGKPGNSPRWGLLLTFEVMAPDYL